MKNNLPNISHETVVFTKHARERLDLRKLGEDAIIHIMRKPNKIYELEDGKFKFIAKTMGTNIHAICKPIPEENKWLVVTLWVRGEDDAGNFINQRKHYKKTRDIYSKYKIALFLWILIVAIIYYFTQIA